MGVALEPHLSFQIRWMASRFRTMAARTHRTQSHFPLWNCLPWCPSAEISLSASLARTTALRVVDLSADTLSLMQWQTGSICMHFLQTGLLSRFDSRLYQNFFWKTRFWTFFLKTGIPASVLLCTRHRIMFYYENSMWHNDRRFPRQAYIADVKIRHHCRGNRMVQWRTGPIICTQWWWPLKPHYPPSRPRSFWA